MTKFWNNKFKKNTDGIKLAITMTIEGSACNFDCEYCYRKGQGVNEKSTKAVFKYSPEHIVKALSRKRLGSRALICICGGGETLLPPEVPVIVKGLLKEGHVVDLISNLTLNQRVDELLEAPREDLERLILKASLHYIELKRLNKLDDYFNNFNRLLNAGASGSPILTTYEQYIPLLDEIKAVCLEKINDLPHVTTALDNFNTTMNPRSFYTPEFVSIIKQKFNSGVFNTFNRLLSIKPSEHFCYAGQWNFILEATTGDIRKCFYQLPEDNIFKNLKSPIKLGVVGHSCCKPNCALNYNWIGMGLIPSLSDFPTYSEILDRPNNYNDTVRQLLNFKFNEVHRPYTVKEQQKIDAQIASKLISKKKIKFKNVIRLKLYNILKRKLEKAGLI